MTRTAISKRANNSQKIKRTFLLELSAFSRVGLPIFVVTWRRFLFFLDLGIMDLGFKSYFALNE